MTAPLAWRPMTEADIDMVEEIAGLIHPSFHERPEIFVERLALFPAGSLIAQGPDGPVGYAVAHPWTLGRPPALDSLLGDIPPEADCLYLHDVAILPAARGQRLTERLVERLRDLAAAHGLGRLALTSVNATAMMWSRYGFVPVVPDAVLAAKLATYGDDATYMETP
jgi:GNAT superfamily N-acetyltransferase